MSVLSAAFYTLLSGNSSIVQSVSTFNGRPSIFTYRPIPKDVEGSYIITVGEISDEPDDTKTTEGRRIVRDILCLSQETGSSKAVESLADRVRNLFHRSTAISISGFKVIHIGVSGPVVADEPKLYGRVLSVECLLAQT